VAGNRHQFILGLVIKKMREEGVTIYAIDGNYPGLFGEKISLPSQIMRHRPDAMGTKANGQICIGEAKTENDIANKRTYEQLHDFSTTILNGAVCEVFVGIPKIGEELFSRTLIKCGLKDSHNIHTIVVPDEIIND